MSAPGTNVEQQARRHRATLAGLVLVVLFALAMFLGHKAYLTQGADAGSEAQGPNPSAVLKSPEAVRAPEAGVGQKPDTNPAESHTSRRAPVADLDTTGTAG